MNVFTDQLVTALKAVLPSVSKDATRLHLHAVLFAHETVDEREHLVLVTTDGHRCVRIAIPAKDVTLDWGSMSVTSKEAKRMLLNLSLAEEDRIDLNQANIGKGKGVARGLEVGRFGLFLRESETFPPYRKIIPALMVPEEAKVVPFAIDPSYFIDAAKVFISVYGRGDTMVVQPVLDPTEPLRFDCCGKHLIKTTVIVMPKRSD